MHSDFGKDDRNQFCNASLAGAQLCRAWGAGEGLVCYDRGRGGDRQLHRKPQLVVG